MSKLVAVVAVLTLTGACAAGEAAVTQRKETSVLARLAMEVQSPPDVPEEPSEDCHPERSLRPQGPLPQPGQMSGGSTMAEIQKRKLVVGTGTNAYLLSYRDPHDGTVLGFEAGIAEEIAFAIFGGDRTKIGERIQYRALNTAERIAALLGVNDKGEKVETVDIVLAGMTMTCERWEKVAFSAEYYSSRQRLLVNHNSRVQSIGDLPGKKVCASATSTNLRPIAMARSYPVPIAATNTGECLLYLQQGKVDAVSTGDIILAGLAAQDPATHIVGPSLRSDPTGIAISPNAPDLVRFVNGVLEKTRSDGTWKQLHERWLAKYTEPAEPPVPQYRPE